MNVKKIIFFIVVLLIATAVLLAGAYFYIEKQILIPADANGGEKLLVIKERESVNDIAMDLQEKKLIKNAFYFKFHLWRNKASNNIKAGQYLLKASMNIPEILKQITEGKIMPEGIWITLQEGLTLKEVDEKFSEAGLIKKGEILNYKIKKTDAEKSPEKDILDLILNAKQNNPISYEFFKDKPEKAGLEGYLFPDTYRFRQNAPVEEIIGKMLENFDKKLDQELRSAIYVQNPLFKNNERLTIFEVIVLASIVQKEVQTFEDMKIAAGIFYNRLNIGMKLEADSTLNYITDSHRDRASYDDLKIDSPYNTYKYAGLPPGPISNPGLEAIKAAIYPAKTDYFYFLTASGGKVIYGKTYEEHLKNKVKWLK